MRIYNNNDAYGDEGPFEAESFEAAADEMQEHFDLWLTQDEDQHDDHGDPDMTLAPRAERLAAMRREYIAGLTEVYTLAMTDGQNDYTDEVHEDCDSYAAAAADAWPLARDYEGTVKYRVYDGDLVVIEEGMI